MSSRFSKGRSRRPTQAAGRPPEPGLLGAWLWVAGYQMTQLGIFLLLAALLLWLAVPSFPPDLPQLAKLVEQLNWETSLLFTGATSLGALLVIVPFVRWRFGSEFRREFGSQRLTMRQAILILGAVTPLSVLSDELYVWGSSLVRSLGEVIPALQILARMDSVHLVQRQVAGSDYSVLLVAIALGPAIGEELIFRGVIGRGLIARKGVVRGVLWTTLFFAAAHLSPAHAIATVPIGLFLHFVYLTTRVLWGPILLHAANNALAVTLMKLEQGPELKVNAPLLFSALGFLVILAVLLRQASQRPDRTPEVVPLRVSHRFPAVAGFGILFYVGVFLATSLSVI